MTKTFKTFGITFTILFTVGLIGFLSFHSCSKSKTPITDSITFESIVGSDYTYIDSVFPDSITHFYEARAYMPERVDSAAKHLTQIDSITTIFAVDQEVWIFNHKIKGDTVLTDTVIHHGPFVEDCTMNWPLPLTFKEMMKIIVSKNLSAPNKDIVLRRALILHPKDYPDFTIYAGSEKWWFISTEDGSVRPDQCSKEWINQYNETRIR